MAYFSMATPHTAGMSIHHGVSTEKIACPAPLENLKCYKWGLLRSVAMRTKCGKWCSATSPDNGPLQASYIRHLEGSSQEMSIFADCRLPSFGLAPTAFAVSARKKRMARLRNAPTRFSSFLMTVRKMYLTHS